MPCPSAPEQASRTVSYFLALPIISSGPIAVCAGTAGPAPRPWLRGSPCGGGLSPRSWATRAPAPPNPTLTEREGRLRPWVPHRIARFPALWRLTCPFSWETRHRKRVADPRRATRIIPSVWKDYRLVNYRFAGSSTPWFSFHAEHGFSGEPSSPQHDRNDKGAYLWIIYAPCGGLERILR